MKLGVKGDSDSFFFGSKTPLIKDIEPVTNDPVYVIGMGVTSEGGHSADQLMGVGISVLSASYCNQQFGAAYITEGMICAGYPPGGKDACQAMGIVIIKFRV